MSNFRENRRGAAPLVSILIISAAVLIIATNVAMIGRVGLDMSLNAGRGKAALNLATSCANETIERIRLDAGYAASSSTLPMEDGSCIIDIVASSSERQITVLGQFEDFYRQLSINLTVAGRAVVVTGWKEY